jgi:protein phosphatase
MGITPNFPRDSRGTGDIVRFGPDRVHSFLKNNNLNMIVRAHECVMNGFQPFAGGSLITVFSATNYCRRNQNAGAILVLKTNLEVVAKSIYPKD